MTDEMKAKSVNGKFYPFWQNLIDDKDTKWVGGVLEEEDGGFCVGKNSASRTEITSITLKPNGTDSAYFTVEGKDFSCGFDVGHGGVTPGEEGWLTFYGYGGHRWRIKPK